MGDRRLEGKVAIVTGGGNGLGRATSLLFARHGAAVAVADWEEKAGQEVVEAIKAEGGRATFVKVDVTKKKDVEQMVDATVRAFGRLDIDANLAGITGHTDFLDITEEALSRMLDVHVKGTFFCMQAAARRMMPQRSGKIINTTSASGITGQSNNAHYSGAKAGIIGITMAAAKALAPYDINVNAVSPLAITRLTEKYPEAVASLQKPSRLMGKWPQPEEIAPVFLFLASEDSNCITGTVLHANNGGHLMGAGEK